jgi:hypothetical protein
VTSGSPIPLHIPTRPHALSLLLFSLVPPSHAATLINGDFETGNFIGWTTGNSNATITSPGLSGNFAATLPGISGGGNLAQTLGNTTASILRLDFSMPDPGGPLDRGFNVFVGQSQNNFQLNIRVVDIDNNGLGDIQIFHTPLNAWQTITPLRGLVSFSDPNSFALKFDSFGASLNYDLSINGVTATSLSFRQNGAPTQFNSLIFSNQFGSSAFTIDNIIVPEPARALLLLLSLTALLSFHRKRPAPSQR